MGIPMPASKLRNQSTTANLAPASAFTSVSGQRSTTSSCLPVRLQGHCLLSAMLCRAASRDLEAPAWDGAAGRTAGSALLTVLLAADEAGGTPRATSVGAAFGESRPTPSEAATAAEGRAAAAQAAALRLDVLLAGFGADFLLAMLAAPCCCASSS